MGVKVPGDPAPNGYVPNPYQAQIDAALVYLRAAKEGSEGWQHIDSKDGIIMAKKHSPGDNTSVPAVRGRGIVKSLSAAALLSAILQPSARHIWDNRFHSGGLLECYGRRSYKFYSVQKGIKFLVSERDIVGVQATVFAEDENPSAGFEVVQTSVEGDPENSGRVRASMTCRGWSVIPRGDDLEVTYVVKINPNGTFPSAAVASFVANVPLAIVNIANFIRDKGVPPYISHKDLKSQLRTEIVDLESRTHVIKFIAGDNPEEVTIVVDPKLFGGKWKVKAAGSGVSAEKKGEASAVVKVPGDAGHYEVTISAA